MRLAYTALLLMVVLLSSALAGCGVSAGTLPVGEVIERADRKMAEVTSFHLTFDRVGTLDVMNTSMEIRNVEGDVVKPDRLQVKMAATLFNVLINLQVVSIGNRAFLTSPFNPSQWVELSGAENPIAFFNPASGVAAMLGQAQNVEKVGMEKINGTSAYHLRGITKAAAKKALLGSLAGDEDITTDFWVDSKDFTVVRMRFTGSFLPHEPNNSVRNLTLSRFGEAVTISPPL